MGQPAQRDCSGCHRTMQLQFSAAAFTLRAGAPAGLRLAQQRRQQPAGGAGAGMLSAFHKAGPGDCAYAWFLAALAKRLQSVYLLPGGEILLVSPLRLPSTVCQVGPFRTGGQAAARSGPLEVGQPLLNLGTCSHYRHSHRWAVLNPF